MKRRLNTDSDTVSNFAHECDDAGKQSKLAHASSMIVFLVAGV